MDVESSAIQTIDYDAPRARLQITFVSGERYAYEAVPSAVHRDFMQADSKGRFFQARIRDRYPTVRLTPRRRGPPRPGREL